MNIKKKNNKDRKRNKKAKGRKRYTAGITLRLACKRLLTKEVKDAATI